MAFLIAPYHHTSPFHSDSRDRDLRGSVFVPHPIGYTYNVHRELRGAHSRPLLQSSFTSAGPWDTARKVDRPGKRTSDAGNRQQLGGFGIGKLLGAGGFGSVELRVDRATNTEYACKKLNAWGDNEDAVNLENEWKLMTTAGTNKHIIQ